jgi:hypothetical protein
MPAHNSIERQGGLEAYWNKQFDAGKLNHAYGIFESWMLREPRPSLTWMRLQLGVSMPTIRKYVKHFEQEKQDVRN